MDQLYSGLGIDPDPVQAAAIKANSHDRAVGLLEANYVGGRRAIRQKIAEILDPDVFVPDATTTHEALLTLAKCRDSRTRLITTNFDRLFEHAIARGRLSAERYEAPLLPVPKQRWDGLVYLHGLLPENPADRNLDNLVVSSGDFGLAYLTERWAARFVSDLLRNFVVCFVGYSIDDPVLRYMMDALAADSLLGESPLEMFAFGSHSRGQKEARTNEWRAKNVTPILYRKHRRHAHLHRTLRTWAETYRDGVRGKERIVVEYARVRPDAATGRDDFVSRMLWALSERNGLPAMRFAELNPVPSLDWLEPLGEDRFKHADLIRFGVPPKASVDESLEFSLTRRPSPYDLAPRMALANWGAHEGQLDEVMFHLTRWLIRHLGNPALILWLVRQRGKLRGDFANRIALRLDKLARLESREIPEELDRIRKDSPDAIPDRRMRTLWGLVLADRVERSGTDLDLHRWRDRFERDGLTTILRLELRDLLSPRVSLRSPFGWPPFDGDEDENDEDSGGMRQLVDWEIVLSAKHVHGDLRELADRESWVSALPTLLTDFTGLLRDALDLKRELGGADDRSDLSYVSQPSIEEHEQNLSLQDWTALIELNRDAWRAAAVVSPGHALLAAEGWSQLPYPLFRRLAFFAAAQQDIVPQSRGLGWLLADDGWWLWSVETQRETMRLLVSLGPQLDEDELVRLERAILAGPPREMYRADIEDERWTRLQESEVWLRLTKISQAGARLGAAAKGRLDEVSAKHQGWRLAENERDEFPTWSGDGGEMRVHVVTPRDRKELMRWLRENPEPDYWRPDDWRERSRIDFDEAALALAALAGEGTWPSGRWREALQSWSEDELLERSWRSIARVLAEMPREVLQRLSHGVSWWLKEQARTFEGQESTFLSLCDRVLALDCEVEEDGDDDDDVVGRAINHPVGHVAEGVLHWWYRSDLEDQGGLADEPRRVFTQLCDTGIPKFRHARVLLATHVISLFRVDRVWAIRNLLPLFEWGNSEAEAHAAWKGFLWSPRLYPPLMERLERAFLETAGHYAGLGRHREQYVSLLTFAGLEPADVFGRRELALAMQSLPQDGLNHAADTFARAVDSAGDQRADYWRNRAAHYLRSIWPSTSDAISASISESFARACIAAGDAFPEALAQVSPWLRPLKYPDRVLYPLRKAKLDTSRPEASLELMNQIVGDAAQGHFPNLATCLSAVRVAQPDLELDPRFQSLLEILRANGWDLD